jgi:hypothetical protein
LITLLVTTALDVGEKLVRQGILDPWYYPFMMVYMVTLFVLPLISDKPRVMQVCGWMLAISMLIWSVFVRSILLG